jgi:hypothetical protein
VSAAYVVDWITDTHIRVRFGTRDVSTQIVHIAPGAKEVHIAVDADGRGAVVLTGGVGQCTSISDAIRAAVALLTAKADL